MQRDGVQLVDVGFHGLAVSCVIGVRESERLSAQDVLLDLSVRYDAARAIASDSLEDAIDYTAAARWCAACLRRSRFRLLERACAALAEGLLDEFSAATEVRVTLRKPRALQEGDYAYASLHRVR
ncbi:MAG: dihydroneopterin aldolase [Spirochaetaceae bacterium]|nr:MAG: dihydroneopterin aldolase [Spirochaetaceae bacterium]